MDFKSLKGSDTSNYKNLLVVDSLNFGFRYKHLGKKQFTTDYMRTIQSFARSYEAKRTIIVGDAGSFWRKSLYPEYKANRKTLIQNQPEEEKQDWEDFFNEMNNTLELLSSQYSVFRYTGVEADDIIAYIIKVLSDDFDKVWILSTDKDLDLLINDKVSRFSYINRKEVTLDNFESIYGYPNSWHLGIKVLMGDSGDNIKGVNSIGVKRAYGLLKQYSGDIFDLIEDIPINGNYVYIKNLNDFGKDNLYMNIELMDLPTYCEEAIGDNNVNSILEQL